MSPDEREPPAQEPEAGGGGEAPQVPATTGPAEAAPPAGTGEGGPQQLVPVPPTPSGAARPQRAPFLPGAERAAITEEPGRERAIVTRAQRRRQRRMELTRRQLLQTSFWGVFFLGLTGSVSAFLAFFWPRGLTGFGGKIAVAADLVPEPGDDPARITVGKFWLSNLRPDEGTHAGFGEEGGGGLLALWWKCPHLGCTVPWRSDFAFDAISGWFRCPCHGSTYTKAGVRVFGPAPRPMDTMDVTVNEDGSLSVNTGVITKGGADNPTRAKPYPI